MGVIPPKEIKIKDAGVLTISEIKGKGLVQNSDGSPVNEYSYSNASFDFTLGDEYFFPKQFHDDLKNAANERSLASVNDLPDSVRQDLLKNDIRLCTANNGFLRIPKFSSVVISTYENVNLPNDVAGRFDLRIKWAMMGLILQVGTQIEPGYNGKLWGLLHNFSGEEVIIGFHSIDHRLLTAEFCYTTQPAAPTKGKEKKPVTIRDFLGKYPVNSGSIQNYFEQFSKMSEDLDKKVSAEIQKISTFNESTTQLINSRIATEVAAIQQLRTSIDNSQQQVQALSTRVHDRRSTQLQWFLTIGIFIISVACPILISKFMFDKDDYQLFDNTKQLNEELNKTNSTIQNLLNESAKKDTVIAKLNKRLSNAEKKLPK